MALLAGKFLFRVNRHIDVATDLWIAVSDGSENRGEQKIGIVRKEIQGARDAGLGHFHEDRVKIGNAVSR